MHQYVEQLVDLTDPTANRLLNLSVDAARERLLRGTPEDVRGHRGFVRPRGSRRQNGAPRAFARPAAAYFLAKRHEGPALIVADRIDAIRDWLDASGFGGQFHPSYTRMVPAHYVVEIQLIGCPDPDPTYTRFFTPERNALPPDLDEIGRRYIGALADEIAKWLQQFQSANRWASASPGASTAARSFSRLITCYESSG
jgi:asparagine synthase (glutamine-hydrolysing)